MLSIAVRTGIFQSLLVDFPADASCEVEFYFIHCFFFIIFIYGGPIFIKISIGCSVLESHFYCEKGRNTGTMVEDKW